MLLLSVIPLLTVWHELALTAIVSAALYIAVYPVRTFLYKVQQKADLLDDIHEELNKQRTNCLSTLQSQGDRQIELLGKTVEVLDGVRLDLREQTGILHTMVVAQPQRLRRAKK